MADERIDSQKAGSDTGSEPEVQRKREETTRPQEKDDGVLVAEQHSSESGTPRVKEAIEQESAPLQDDLPHGLALWSLIVALFLGMFLTALDSTIVATAIPKINEEFGSLDQSGWYGSAFFMTLAVFQAPWGKINTLFPLRISYIVALLIFELGSLACGVSKSSNGLIAGRAIQGVGAAGVNLGNFVIIRFIVDKSKVPSYLGLFGAVYSLASVAGPLLGGAFASKLTWRWCFYINLPFGGLTLVLFLLFFRTPRAHKPLQVTWIERIKRLDVPGIALILGSLTCYMLALEYGGVQKPWNSTVVIVLLVLWISFLCLFAADQVYQGDRALLVTRILLTRNIASLAAFIFFLNAANFLMIYYLPEYFQAIDGATAAESGVRNLPYILSASIAAFTAGHVLRRVGHIFPFLVGGSALAVVGASLLYTLNKTTTTGEYIGYQIVLGVGVGITIQVPLNAAQAMSRSEDIPITSATILFFQYISGAFSVSAAQSSFQNQLIDGLQRQKPPIDISAVLTAGASGLRSAFTPTQVSRILDSYLSGLEAAWALGIALAGLSLVMSFVPERISIKRPAASKAAK